MRLLVVIALFSSFRLIAADSLIQNLSYKQGLARAIEEQKVLIVKIDADWCKPCKELTAEFESNANFRSVVEQHAIIIRLNAGDSKAKEFLIDRKVRSYPSVYMESPTGKGYLEYIGKQPIQNYINAIQELANPTQSNMFKWRLALSKGVASQSEILAYSKELVRYHLEPDALILQYLSEINMASADVIDIEIFSLNYTEVVDRLHRETVLQHLIVWQSINPKSATNIFNTVALYVYHEAVRKNDSEILHGFVDENLKLIQFLSGKSDRKAIIDYIESLVEHSL